MSTELNSSTKIEVSTSDGNIANAVLAAVNSVFTRHKPFFRFSDAEIIEEAFKNRGTQRSPFGIGS